MVPVHAIDWADIHDKYRGQWVALDGQTVVASGKTAKEALKKAQGLGHASPVLVPSSEFSTLHELSSPAR